MKSRKSTDDFKLEYKSPKYLRKKKAEDLECSFIPKTNLNLDHVIVIDLIFRYMAEYTTRL